MRCEWSQGAWVRIWGAQFSGKLEKRLKFVLFSHVVVDVVKNEIS